MGHDLKSKFGVRFCEYGGALYSIASSALTVFVVEKFLPQHKS
jgi:hypothetical protein